MTGATFTKVGQNKLRTMLYAFTCSLSAEYSAQNCDSIFCSFLSSSESWNAVRMGSDDVREMREGEARAR